MGEDNGRKVKILRNFQNPNSGTYPQPDTYKGPLWANPMSPADYGGVHQNSGPLNKFVYELVQLVGWDVAAQVIVGAWNLLNATSDFIQYRDALKKSSIGNNCIAQVQQCLNTVGLTDVAVSDWHQ